MSLLTRTDVTAVKFYRNVILAGIGSTVNLFDKASTKLVQRLNGLNGQKIYGFVPAQCGDIILVFGGKQFTVISADTSEKPRNERIYNRVFEPIVCDDWLHSAVWIDDELVAVLTAHNVVQKWNTITQTLISQNTSPDNSILYSGLVLPLQDDVLVMAGTVFSEVIIHRCNGDKPLHHLRGHKGVIFSISCEPHKNIVVTTSDDRSVRIWGPNTTPRHPHNTAEYWEAINIVCKHEVYGHLARVMRSCITNDIIVSVGEDSAICYWDYEGKLLRKALTHQNACIWSVDTDGHNLVTGGGDCGVIIHPLTIATEYCHNDVIDTGVATPKKVVFTARKNILILDENKLIYYDVSSNNKTEHILNHESTYKLLSLSTCKQLVAVADMNGKLDVFVEKCKDEAFILNVIDTKLSVEKILSMHWAGNRHLILCSGDGQITVLASNGAKVEDYANFVLPHCKERWLTATAINVFNNNFVFGDRCGNIHIFVKGQRNPVKSFSKVHGRYGPTSITLRNNNIITTGRDGTIKYFRINDGTVKYMSSKILAFDWIEKFLDKDDNIVCGFQERVFVVYNIKDNNKILEVPCGGGHRSWDAIKYFEKVKENYEEFIKLIYLKNSDINVTTIQLSKIVSRNVINGSHAKEVNCLRAHKVENATVYISGGEDTTLRISSVDEEMSFKDEVCFKHLSSIRTLKTFPLGYNRLLVLSAGGRAQLCIKDIKLTKENCRILVSSEELIDYQIKGTDKERKGNQTWRNCSVDFDPEMRIMDLDLMRDTDSYIIFAGCSDSYLRVFSFKQDSKKVEYLKESKFHKTCILKIKLIQVLDKDILISCTTRGDVTLWDTTTITESDFKPFFSTKTNKSGINSIDTAILTENKILITTGGDDNAIHIIVLEIPDQNDLSSTKVLYTWNGSNYHSSQITGLCLLGDYLLSVSIDQRITLLRWWVTEEGIECKFLSQTHTDVADVQGMDLLDHNRFERFATLFYLLIFLKEMSANRRGPTGSKPTGAKGLIPKGRLGPGMKGKEGTGRYDNSMRVWERNGGCSCSESCRIVACGGDKGWLLRVKRSRHLQDPVEPSVSAVVSPVTFGTGPHWVQETQSLYYVSVFGKTLMRYSDGSHFKAKMDGMPSFIIPIEGKNNHFAVGLDQKVVEIQWDGGLNGAKVLRTIAEVHMEDPEDSFSHGKADPRGRLFAGSMSHKNDTARTNKKNGILYRFAEDGTPHEVLNNIDVSRGLCWDLARKAFYLIDNYNYNIRRYDYDVETGNISNPQIVFAMQDQEYILANTNTNNNENELIYEDFDPKNHLRDPQGSTPGDSQDVKIDPHVARQGNTQDYDEGNPQGYTHGGLQDDPQGDPRTLEIDQDVGGLLDRDNYYENDISSGTETNGDDTDGSDDNPGGSEDVAPGRPGHVEDGLQIRRQSDLQGFAQSGPQVASQSYTPSGLQDYSQSDPEVATPVGPESDDHGDPQGIGYGGPQRASQSYASGGPQGYTSDIAIGNARRGPDGDAPGGPEGDTPAGPEADVPHIYGSESDVESGPQTGRKNATVQDYYSQGIDLSEPQDPGGPERNITDDYLDYVRDDAQNQAPGGPLDYGPPDSDGFAPGGRQGYGSSGFVVTKGIERAGNYKKKLTGTLDGMTIDTEGNLWVANYHGSQVLKIDPKQGILLHVIPVEALLVTSVTFGGPELDVLYVTSAATDKMGQKEQRSPAGATFSITSTGVKGQPSNNVRFKQSTTRSRRPKADKYIDLT